MNTYRFLAALSLFFIVGISLQAQQSLPFEFKEGIYTDYAAFQKNAPVLEQKQHTENVQYRFAKDDNILVLENSSIDYLKNQQIHLDSIWGINIKGQPYIRVPSPKGNSEAYFVRLHVVGKICYFYYKTFQEKTVKAAIYNPYTGEKMGEKPIINKEQVLVEQIFKFEDGTIQNFNLPTLKDWTAHDTALAKALDEISNQDASEKLFKTLLIYNDRHPLH